MENLGYLGTANPLPPLCSACGCELFDSDDSDPNGAECNHCYRAPTCDCGQPVYRAGLCRGCDEDHFYGRAVGQAHRGVE